MTISQLVSYNKKNPYLARLVERRRLNQYSPKKETWHFVIDCSGSGITYQAGDTIGVFPSNCPKIVESILRTLKFTGDEPVLLPKAIQPIPIRQALTKNCSLANPTKVLLQAFVNLLQSSLEKETLNTILNLSQEELKAFISNRELIDLIDEFPSISCTPQTLVHHLRPLQPRLYSIASSPRLYPNEIHLTVSIIRYNTNNRQRLGITSTFLADRIPLNQPLLPIFVTHSHFKLPQNPSTNIIMVGPGTGIAPFRGFLQDRKASGAKGKNWLFFGEQYKASDFLYENELKTFQQNATLTHLDLAFSRDQKDKIYVQDRMLEKASKLWQWIHNGAYFYLCGDATYMAKDVDAALHKICETQGNINPHQATAYLKQLKKEKRYQKDVY